MIEAMTDDDRNTASRASNEALMVAALNLRMIERAMDRDPQDGDDAVKANAGSVHVDRPLCS